MKKPGKLLRIRWRNKNRRRMVLFWQNKGTYIQSL